MSKIPASLRLFVLSLILAGAAHAANAPDTLKGNKQLPVDDIKGFLSKADWEEFSAKKISRIVAFRAAIRSDTSVTPGRVFKAIPDASWNEVARGFAAKARINYSSTSSGLSPRANIYVVFFAPEPSGDSLVLVYGEEAGSNGRPSEAPDPTGQSAAGPKYLQTFPVEKPK